MPRIRLIRGKWFANKYLHPIPPTDFSRVGYLGIKGVILDTFALMEIMCMDGYISMFSAAFTKGNNFVLLYWIQNNSKMGSALRGQNLSWWKN